MNTQKLLKKLNKFDLFTVITIEGDKKITATFKDEINDSDLNDIVKNFDRRHFDYCIKIADGKMVFEIKNNRFNMPTYRPWLHTPRTGFPLHPRF